MPETEPPPAWAIEITKVALLRGSHAGRTHALACAEAALLLEDDFILACGGSPVRREGDMVVVFHPERVLWECCNDLQRAVIHYILAEASL